MEGVTEANRQSKKHVEEEERRETSNLERSLVRIRFIVRHHAFDITNDARFNLKKKEKKKERSHGLLSLGSGDNRTNFEARRSTIDPLPPIPITRRIPSSGEARRKSAQRSPTLKPRPLLPLFFPFPLFLHTYITTLVPSL